jgi:hypothetical protein
MGPCCPAFSNNYFIVQELWTRAEIRFTAIQLRVAIMVALTIVDEYHSATGQLGLGTQH